MPSLHPRCILVLAEETLEPGLCLSFRGSWLRRLPLLWPDRQDLTGLAKLSSHKRAEQSKNYDVAVASISGWKGKSIGSQAQQLWVGWALSVSVELKVLRKQA